jgi:hypothetical protein
MPMALQIARVRIRIDGHWFMSLLPILVISKEDQLQIERIWRIYGSRELGTDQAGNPDMRREK